MRQEAGFFSPSSLYRPSVRVLWVMMMTVLGPVRLLIGGGGVDGGEVRWAMGGSRSLLFCFGGAANHAGQQWSLAR